ncbi:16S rRNA (cytosine(1402)-N(4))-methyltransferase RsmH [bacterium]|nr:16S rRNA (cytosine(1402)-N(4))-methyltransferase RsmH [bacterium]
MIGDRVNSIPEHQPVMVSEVMSHLITDVNGIYIDGTIGLGGHSKEILSSLNKKGHLIGIDRDDKTLSIAEKNLARISTNFSLYNRSYADTDLIIKEFGKQAVNGILLDLGLSSAQLNDQSRGFSFNGDGTLDMRFDQQHGATAEQILLSKPETEIADFIRLYSEERYAKKIAYNIKRAEKMATVDDIREAIRLSTPPAKRNRTFARVFQAIRILVNDELNQLNIFLDKFINQLCIGGKIVIISYHSLEDRLVKLAFKKLKAEGQLLILTKRPLIATNDEVTENSRSKSAKLRAGERIK